MAKTRTIRLVADKGHKYESERLSVTVRTTDYYLSVHKNITFLIFIATLFDGEDR